MNVSPPDTPQPGAPSEGAVMRFLRWLIEPAAGSQPRELRVLRWLLRGAALLLWCLIVGDGGFDHQTGGGGVGRKNAKPGKPPA